MDTKTKKKKEQIPQGYVLDAIYMKFGFDLTKILNKMVHVDLKNHDQLE